MVKVWGFGSAAVDIRLKTAEYGEGYLQKLLSQESLWLGGGSMANALSQITRLGGTAGWLGKLGDDIFGRFIRKSLTTELVDVSSVIQDPQGLSPFNIAVYAGDSLRRVGGYLLPNCLGSFTSQEIHYLAESISSDDILFMEVGEIPVPICLEFAYAAKSRGSKIIIDVDLDPIKQCRASENDINSLFSLCDVLMPNETSMASLFPNQSGFGLLQRIHEKYGNSVVITEGENGAKCLVNDGAYMEKSSLAVPVVDTVGAGDAFHGGFLQALSLGLDFMGALTLGTICGAHNCKSFGPRNGMIRKKELSLYKEYIKEWIF